jgi:hypothetical protein
MSRQPFGRRINTWLAEPSGEIFRDGKWRFWFPTLLGLTALNALMTAVIFGSDGMQKYIGSIVVLAGAVLCWLALGLLHYSDSEDRKLSIGVATLDSVTLLFVAAHFSFLLWCQGHLWTLREAEAQYRTDMATYNAQWTPVKDSNERIAGSVERIAQIEKETERLRNDTAYWSRRNKLQTGKSGLEFKAAITPMEVPPPPKEPVESSAAFLAGWDSWIRLAGFGELGLSIITLIFVRTRTAARNRIAPVEEFPDELEIENRLPIKREKFSPKKETRRTIDSFDSAKYAAGAQALRDALKDISFRLKGYSFKVTVKPDSVWIMMVEAVQGTQQTVSSCRCELAILRDAETMPRDKFARKLELTLRRGGFEI